MKSLRILGAALLPFVVLIFSMKAFSDEGMWLFNGLPIDQIEKNYGFKPTQEWLDHVMKSSARESDGGSTSFVSANGLILTNHHVASGALFNISTPEHDYMKTGFYAHTLEEEVPAPGIYVDQLESFDDVTTRIQGAIKPGMTEEQANLAKQSEMEKARAECKAKTSLDCEVVTLYKGARYHLYRYKRYMDIRIVFAPEKSIAFFGGDPDNFEYPRFDLDMAIFRAYENGKPAQIKNFLKWSAQGPKKNELVFMSGNPGGTDRSLTVDSLLTIQKLTNPFSLSYLQTWEKAILQYEKQGGETKRRGDSYLFTVQNSRKVYFTRSKELTDAVIEKKRMQENDMIKRLKSDPKLAPLADAWSQVQKLEQQKRANYLRYALLESSRGFITKLFGYARALVRLPVENAKASDQRLPEYSDTKREVLKQKLLSKEPTFADIEEVNLATGLTLLKHYLPSDPLTQKILAGKAPKVRAHELIQGTALMDPAVREDIMNRGQDGLASYKGDTMIQLAQLVDDEARKARTEREAKIDTPLELAYKKIGDAKFKLFGTSVYPDATFSPRITYGAVKGYLEGKTPIAPFTTMGGAFKHEEEHGAKDPYLLPDSWAKSKGQLNLDTPLNFISTCDIIGGNSGSPTINAQGELVGLVFDGNIHSIMGDFYYDPALNRALSVHSAGMLEALNKIYKTTALVAELLNGAAPQGTAISLEDAQKRYAVRTPQGKKTK